MTKALFGKYKKKSLTSLSSPPLFWPINEIQCKKSKNVCETRLHQYVKASW